jgi:hypothetical protein
MLDEMTVNPLVNGTGRNPGDVNLNPGGGGLARSAAAKPDSQEKENPGGGQAPERKNRKGSRMDVMTQHGPGDIL